MTNEPTRPDWLEDPAAAPDAEEARLEQALAPLRYDVERHPLQLEAEARSPRSWRRSALLAGLAATLLVAAWLLWRSAAPTPGASPFEVLATTGGVEQDSGRIVCGADASARVRVGSIGSFELEPHSVLRLERGSETGYTVYLEQGALTATIFAAPRLFTVGTPAGLAVDLGCIYRTEVEPNGATRLSVVSGRVSFESDGRHSLVPAGAACTATPGIGPSAPVWAGAAAVLRDAALRFDALGAGAERLELVRSGLAASTRRDSLTLIHLLERAAPSERELLVDGLSALAGRPADLDRARLVAGDPPALAQWRTALEVDW